MSDQAATVWNDALTAIRLVETASLSLLLRARSGPVVDALLARLDKSATLRITPDVADAAWDGGIDLLASLATGASVHRRGIAARAAGRLLVVRGADRLSTAGAAQLARLMERWQPMLLLDEGVGEKRTSASLVGGVSMIVELDDVSLRDLIDVDEADLGEAVEDVVAPLTEVAVALGIASLRVPSSAVRVARARAALRGDTEVRASDLLFASRTVLAPRATCVPASVSKPEAEPMSPEGENVDRDIDGSKEVEERLVEATLSALPRHLLEHAASRGDAGIARQAGRAPAKRGVAGRGRRGPVRADVPGRGGRLDLIATLVAAAPFQPLRGRTQGERLAVRRSDLRVRRPRPQRIAQTVFVVDASGSAAIARLGEVKGAIEQLLGESYVRRDEVALIAFRGDGAQTLLPPTRSLARVRRELASLPGGGGTPLAAGLEAGIAQALRSRAAGRQPLMVLLTDGGANVARDGAHGRARARSDAEAAAERAATAGLATLVIDSSPRGSEAVRALADRMGGRYLALPRVNDRALSSLVAGAR